MDLGNLKDLLGNAGSVGDTLKNVTNEVKNIAKDSISDIKSGSGENVRNEAFKKICALIPGKVDNSLVINAFEAMRKQQKLMKKDFSAHLKVNEEAFKKHVDIIKKNKGFVEDQNNFTDMNYGDSTMQYSGCEVFATYNAMYSIDGKNTISLPAMIAEYEKDGMVLSGKFGTSPKAIADFLNKHGYKAELVTEEAKFDNLGKTYQSLILTMYNDGSDISQEVHTVNISKENGQFIAHNVYCNGKVVGPYKSVTEVIKNINGGKAKGISLIGVKKA